MSETLKTGGEVDAFCNKDKLVLAHVILAMVGSRIARVKCNTCGSEHAFRGTNIPKPKKPRAPKAGDKASKVVISFQQRIEGKDASKARKYNPQATFALEELIDHPTFGLGIISAIRDEKIDVAFKAFEKTLVHGRRPAGEPEPVEQPAPSAPPPAAPKAQA